MTDGKSLTYEQPLAPGEARQDVGRESVGLSWRVCREDAFWQVFGTSLPAAIYMGLGLLQIPRSSSQTLFEWCIAGGLILLSVLMMTRVADPARRVRFVWASRERLTWSGPAGRGERTIPMSDVRGFAVEATWKDYTFVVRLHEQKITRARWYQVALGRGTRAPEELLAHVDREFVKRAAFELNMLLAAA